MPDRALHPCAYRGCAGLTRARYCEKHIAYGKHIEQAVKQRYDTERENAADRGYDSDWMRLRDAYLRSHPLCEECERQGRTTIATLVHHKISLRDGGERLCVMNLQSVCLKCHQEIHKGDIWGYKKARY
jgi:5-methylcytosine-specific restriction protein A